MTTNVPGWQQQHSHNGSLAAVDRRRRCRSSSRKIDPDTLVSFYFTHSFLTCFGNRFPLSFFLLWKFFQQGSLAFQRTSHRGENNYIFPRHHFYFFSISVPVTFPAVSLSHEFLHVDSEVGRRWSTKSVEMCRPKPNGYYRLIHRRTRSAGCVSVPSSSSSNSSSSSDGGPKGTDDCDDHGGGGGSGSGSDGDDDDDPMSGVLLRALRSSISSRSEHTFRRFRPSPLLAAV